MRGTLTDISLHGCYLQMTTTFPVGTKVDLVLNSLDFKIKTLGTIRATYPSLGMGISFSEMQSEQVERLQQLLVSLSGGMGASAGGSV